MIETTINNKITDKPYWEKYYKKQTADVEIIKANGRVYDRYWAACVDDKTKSVIEIGAFPGRYLSYISDKYDLRPTALDYQSDLSVIEESFKAFDIPDYDLINEDFLEWNSENKYDLVLSIGFVEHFENYEEIIGRHFRLLKSGGKVFFHIPNKKFIRKIYGQIADRDNLKAHNLKVMSFDVFKKAAAENNMEIEILEYFGPFQYGLHGGPLSTFRKFLFYSFRFFFKTLNLNKLVEKYPSKIWSSCIICVMRKK